MKNYIIHRAGEERELGAVTVTVHDVGKQFWLDPKRSQALRNHSPDGFEFGYGGSGPSQLALGILLDFTDSPQQAMRWYQEFKWQFIGGVKHPGGTILGNDIADWLRKMEAK
jgi:hypothetical protein